MAKKVKIFDHNSILPEDVAKCFVVKLKRSTDTTKINFHKYGVVDFKNLSLKRAQHLVNLGADFIAPRNDNQEA